MIVSIEGVGAVERVWRGGEEGLTPSVAVKTRAAKVELSSSHREIEEAL